MEPSSTVPTRGIIPLGKIGAIRAPQFFAYLILLFFWFISLHHLTIVPRVDWDETWIASTGWKLADQGVFGSDLFAGLNGMDHHYYGFLPLFPLLLAGTFRVAGLGLFQDRFVVVVMSVLALALTYALVQRLFKNSLMAVLALSLLIAAPLAAVNAWRLSGILFLDSARIARYDLPVATFGLASLLAYVIADEKGSGRYYLIAGLLAGLAGLTQGFGVFWLPVLLILIGWNGRGRDQTNGDSRSRAIYGRLAVTSAVLLGFLIPWLIYLPYVLGDIPDWRAQMQVNDNRFDLLNARWYLQNLIEEPQRYNPGLDLSGTAGLLRVGFWSALVLLPSSMIALARRAFHSDRSARVAFVAALIMPILFALLIHVKNPNYSAAFYPLGAIVAGWGGITFWRWLARTRWTRGGHALLIALLIAVLAEGATRIATLEQAAGTTTPYYQFVAQLRRTLPDQARILGWHHYWFGLKDFDYRSFWVPFAWLDRRNEPRPLRFDEALDRVAPDVVLVDDLMRRYLTVIALPSDPNPRLFYDWMKHHDAQLVGRVDDPTYGLVEIYRVTRSNGSAATKPP